MCDNKNISSQKVRDFEYLKTCLIHRRTELFSARNKQQSESCHISRSNNNHNSRYSDVTVQQHQSNNLRVTTITKTMATAIFNRLLFLQTSSDEAVNANARIPNPSLRTRSSEEHLHVKNLPVSHRRKDHHNELSQKLSVAPTSSKPTPWSRKRNWSAGRQRANRCPCATTNPTSHQLSGTT